MQHLQTLVIRQLKGYQLSGETQTFVIQLVPDATQIHSTQAPELDLGQGPCPLSQVTVILQKDARLLADLPAQDCVLMGRPCHRQSPCCPRWPHNACATLQPAGRPTRFCSLIGGCNCTAANRFACAVLPAIAQAQAPVAASSFCMRP